MYCKYIVGASPTTAQIRADIVGLLTATITTVAGLSASANHTTSTVTTTIAAGWSTHDTSAFVNSGSYGDQNGPVLKSALLAFSGKYKYLQVVNGTTDLGVPDSVILSNWLSWNNTTHAGVSGFGTTGFLPIASLVLTTATHLVTGATLHITADVNGVAILYQNTGGLFDYTCSYLYEQVDMKDPQMVTANTASVVPVVAGAGAGQTGTQLAIPAMYILNGGISTGVGGMALIPEYFGIAANGQGVVGAALNATQQFLIADRFYRTNSYGYPMVGGRGQFLGLSNMVCDSSLVVDGDTVTNGGYTWLILGTVGVPIAVRMA